MITIKIKIKDEKLPEVVEALTQAGGWEKDVDNPETDEVFVTECLTSLIKDAVKSLRKRRLPDEDITLE